MNSGVGTQSATAAAPAKRQAFKAILLALAIEVVALAVYAPVKHYDFADVDDAAYVSENLHVKFGLDWDTVKWSFTTYYQDWHPLTWLSHALDCQLFGVNAGRHHNVNVLLHGLNAALLFWVLLRATGYLGRSAMVAALFALHPINVESVVWIAERKNLVSMLFFLLALGAYGWYAEKPRVGRYCLVALLFALALMSKSQVITLPFVLLLWDYWPLYRIAGSAPEKTISKVRALPTRTLQWLIVEKLPLLALCAGSAILTLHAQRLGGAMNPLNTYPLWTRIENAVLSYARYLGKALWPSHLSAFYPYPHGPISIAPAVAAGILLIIVTALVVVNRERRYLFVGWFWFLGTLVPMIGLVHVGDHSMADRYGYLSFVGLFIMICWGAAELASRWTGGRSTAWLAAPGLAILLALTLVTHRQIEYWKNSVTLWSHAVAVTRDNDAAETLLGEALLKQYRTEAAIPHFRRAIAIFPESPKAYMFLGYAEQQSGHPQAALQYFQQALDLDQRYGDVGASIRLFTLQAMAFAYRDLGDFPHAVKCMEAAQELEQSGASPLAR